MSSVGNGYGLTDEAIQESSDIENIGQWSSYGGYVSLVFRMITDRLRDCAVYTF